MRPASRVYTPAWRPYFVSLASRIPSANERYGETVSTGPKTSSLHTFMRRVNRARMVGPRALPRRAARSRTLAPSASASAVHDLTRAIAPSSISGPTTVSGRRGSPPASRRGAARTRRGERQARERAGRRARAGQELREPERGERRLGRRLEDDRASSPDGGRHFVGDQVERKIERRDRRHDA